MFRPKSLSAGLILVALMWIEVAPMAARSASAPCKITNVSVETQPDRIVIAVKGNGPLRYQERRLSRPERLLFDFRSTTLPQNIERSLTQDSPVASVRLGLHRSRYPWVRMVLTLRGAPSFRTSISDDRSELKVEVVSPEGKGATAFSAAVKSDVPVLPDIHVKTRPAAATSPDPEVVARLMEEESSPKQSARKAEKPARPPVKVVAAAEKPQRMAKPRQQAAPGREEPRKEARPQEVRPAPATRVVSMGPGTIDMDFVNADLSDVAKALSIQSGKNVAVSGTAQGKVTLRLRRTSLEEALRLVASLNGLDYRQIGNVYIIASPADLKRMAANTGVTRTYITKHIAPSDAADLLGRTYPHLTIQPQPQTGALTLQGLPQDVDKAMETLSEIDVPPAPGTNITETLVPKYIAAPALSQTLRNAIPQLNIQQQAKALVITGTKANLDKAKQVVTALDVETAVSKVQKVLTLKYITAGQVEAMITKEAFPDITVVAGPEVYTIPIPRFSAITAAETFQIGGGAGGGLGGGLGGGAGAAGGYQQTAGQAGTKAGSTAKTVILEGSAEAVDRVAKLIEEVDVAPPQVMIEAKVLDISPEETSNLGLSWSESVPFGVDESSPARNGFSFGTFRRSALSIDAAINAAVTSKKAKILANPRIAVLDDQDANIFIGDLLRYTILVSVTATGSQFDVRDVPVGIILLVRPRVSPDGNITMKIHPVVSTVTAMIPTPNGSIPQTSSREADSTIRVKDGETLVIGGLLREEDLRTITKVPILGDLPLFGALFQNRQKSHRRSEVMVFLTPKIMSNE